MDNFLQYLPVAVLAVGAIAGYATLRSQVKINTEDIKEIEEDYINGHDHKLMQKACKAGISSDLTKCQLNLSSDIVSMKKDIKDIKASAIRTEQYREDMAKAVNKVVISIVAIESKLEHRRKDD